MRPTKLSPHVLTAFREVLNEWNNAMVCTDFELCHLVNKRLPEADQISYRTFQRYKAKCMNEDTRMHYGEDVDKYKELHDLWTDAIIKQKNILFDKLTKGDHREYLRYRWIFERKFTEWNGRSIMVEGMPLQEYLKRLHTPVPRLEPRRLDINGKEYNRRQKEVIYSNEYEDGTPVPDELLRK